MVVVVAIVVVLFVVVVFPRMRVASPTPGKPMPEAAMERGKDVECMQNLRSIREAIVMYKTESEANPASLADLKMGVRPDFFKCPVGREAYVYDPNTGAARCQHPGHGRY